MKEGRDGGKLFGRMLRNGGNLNKLDHSPLTVMFLVNVPISFRMLHE